MAHWHPLQKLLHWTIAAMLLAMVAAGLTMTRAADTAAATGDYTARVLGLTIFDAYQLHKSIGVVLFALVLLRLIVRLRLSGPAFPDHMPRLERLAARGAHLALYALMLSLPVTGWLMASASPLGIPTIVFGLFALPHPIGPDADLETVLSVLHLGGGLALLALTALHVAAALKHHLIDHDDVLLAMLPRLRRRDVRRMSVVLVAITLGWTATPAPAQLAWSVTSDESSLSFTVQVGGAEARGNFGRWTAEIEFDPAAPEDGAVTVRVDIASVFIDTAQARTAIAGADWLDAERFPQADFFGAGFVLREDGDFALPGTLTLRGTSRPLTLEGNLDIDGDTATATLSATLLRLDFGVGTPDPSVSPQVRIDATLVATRDQ